MTLPVSGAISFNDINVELGVGGTTQASLGQTTYRNLAGVPSGAISMSNFYGKANQFAFTISSNQTNANLRTLAVNAGWNQASKVVATINSGVYIYATSTGTPALTINGSFPGGVELVNNGTIQGQGGAGGNGGSGYPVYSAYDPRNLGTVGSSGGLGLSVSVAVTVQNNGRIAGGGGGGGGGGGAPFYAGKSSYYAAGGGGGGGLGGNGGSGGAAGPNNYGGGTLPQAGGAGTLTSNGSGGLGGYTYNANTRAGAGGAGGSYGADGSYSTPGNNGAGTRAGGAGGGAVAGNANITWTAFGTRNGGIT